MIHALRPYQTAAVEGLRAHVRNSRRRVLLVSPTGSGKTVIMAEIIHGAVSRGGSVVFLAHRKELIDQTSARLDLVGVDHGVVQGKHPREQPWARVQVASVQTLARRLDRLPDATLLIIDEAHHARAATYSHIVDRYPGIVVLGATATPWRLDNRGLGELFEELVVAARPRELVQQGHLVPYTGFAYDMPDLERVHRQGADYKGDELALVMGGAKLAGNVVAQWLAHCRGRRTVVFAVNVAHSMALVSRFKAAGVVAEHVDGTTPTPEREGVLSRLATGETPVVCNVNVLTEGFDCPAIEVCVLARPTLSVGLYLQMVGRGMRPSPATGKSQLRIHDHAGLVMRHGLPDAEREYTLDADKRRAAALDPSLALRRCTHCFALFASDLSTCPQCGQAPVARPRVVKEDETAAAIPIEQLAGHHEVRRAYLDEQLRIAEASGKKRGWAAYRYRERFGEWPPSHFWSRSAGRLDAAKLQALNERLKAHLGGGR